MEVWHEIAVEDSVISNVNLNSCSGPRQMLNQEMPIMDDEERQSFKGIWSCEACGCNPELGSAAADLQSLYDVKSLSNLIERMTQGKTRETTEEELWNQEIFPVCPMSAYPTEIVQDVLQASQGRVIHNSLSLPDDVPAPIRRGIIEYFTARNAAKGWISKKKAERDRERSKKSKSSPEY